MNENERTWKDQPAILLRCKKLSHFSIGDGNSVEIRKYEVFEGDRSLPDALNSEYYVTVGSLFGSQTVHCPTAEHVFALLGTLSVKASKRRLPDGVEIVANAPAVSA